jgi:lipoic acid synthetase
MELLVRAKQFGSTTKTGLMLGLGEERKEISIVLLQLKQSECDTLTLGQYLQAGKNNLPVSKYYRPEEFTEIREEALSLGLRRVIAGPLVRSSYRAAEFGSTINKY